MDKDLLARVNHFRWFSILLNLFSVAQLILAVVLPDLLPSLLKIWLVSVSGASFVGLTVGLLLARRDPSTTLFFTYLSSFVSGLVSGIALVAIVAKVKNG